MTFSILEGWWTDAGTIDSLRRATNLVAETGANKVDYGTAFDGGPRRRLSHPALRRDARVARTQTMACARRRDSPADGLSERRAMPRNE